MNHRFNSILLLSLLFASLPLVAATQVLVWEPVTQTVVDQVMSAVQRNTEYVHFPWMEADKWKAISKGMAADGVKAVLGEPTLEDPSLHKRIDIVYTYRGRRSASGEKVVGKVKFYRGEVVEIEAP